MATYKERERNGCLEREGTKLKIIWIYSYSLSLESCKCFPFFKKIKVRNAIIKNWKQTETKQANYVSSCQH